MPTLSGLHLPEVGMRTGDTPARERQAMLRRPPDLLITTPESLYLMLTSNAADTLANVETVIVDEIHALAATKRGAHLAVSLERLEEVDDEIRRSASACRRPSARSPRSLASSVVGRRPACRATSPSSTPGSPSRSRSTSSSRSRTCPTSVVRRPSSRPTPGCTAVWPRSPSRPAAPSIWPSIYPRILEQILAHRSTIVFCNARRQAERLAAKLNELYDEQFPHRRRGRRAPRRAGQGAPRFARP